MSTRLQLGKTAAGKRFTLPLDVAGEAIGILATRGAGKSYTSAALVEELHRAGVQLIVLDPTGVYWGLRSSADGEKGALPIFVLGGPHGDVPLEATAGALIADLVVDSGQSFVLDLSDFPTKADQTRFVTAFAERLYRKKARDRTTLHLVIDEADDFAPQRHMPKEAAMLGAMEALVRRGRSRGLGVTLITQRSATLNKNVLDLIDTLIVLRMGSPRDQAAVKGWINTKDLRDELGVMESLPGLPTGTAWIWSPVRGVLEKVAVRRIETFDSYATPKPGKKRIEPAERFPIDVELLGEQIKATAERAKENDPKILRKRIVELERDLAKAGKPGTKVPARAPGPDPAAIEARIQREVAKAVTAERKRLEGDYKALSKVLGRAQVAAAEVVRASSSRRRTPRRPRFLKFREERGTAPVRLSSPPSSSRAADPPRPVKRLEGPPADGVTRPQQRILDALASMEQLGVESLDRAALAALAGAPHTSGGYRNNLGVLRSQAGAIEYPQPNVVRLTEQGRAIARPTIAIETAADLHQFVFSVITAPQAALLREILAAHPDPVNREQLAEAVNVPSTSGGFRNNLGRLRTLGFIDYPQPGLVSVAAILFPEGLDG